MAVKVIHCYNRLAFAALAAVSQIAKVNVSKPYKPRKLKTDTYHSLLRQARKRKPKDSTKEAQRKRTRSKWVLKNKDALKRRAQYVRRQRRNMGLNKS